MNKNEQSFRGVWDTMINTDVDMFMGKKKKRKKGQKNFFKEIMTDNFQNLINVSFHL